VWVREIEIASIARCLKLDVAEFARTYLRKTRRDYALVEMANGDCVFWTPAGGCRIYEVRPTQCRTFPFWWEYMRSPRAWAEAARRCPGVNHGRLYLPQEIDHLVELTDF
jgi:Fe-S-cluster containining protein